MTARNYFPHRMNIARVFTVVLLSQALCCFGRDTAYQALRAIGTAKGQDVLNHVIKVQGRNGEPQPARWKVVTDDATAPGGVREFEVENGRIVSEHTPVKSYSGTATNAVMDFQKLNLDS